MYYVYTLLDYKGFPFYIGITKNLPIRIREHEQGKNATPAKIYRVHRCIATHGYLRHNYQICANKEEALLVEAKLIKLYSLQLVNKSHGAVKREDTQRRSKGKSVQCKKCGNWFKKINSHKCKE